MRLYNWHNFLSALCGHIHTISVFHLYLIICICVCDHFVRRRARMNKAKARGHHKLKSATERKTSC